MMVVDSSAVMAFLCGAPQADQIEELLDVTAVSHMSAVTAFECRALLFVRYGEPVLKEFDRLVERVGIIQRPFDRMQAALAYDAYRRFGRAHGHPARLTLAGCASYALARSLGMPLLFVGPDFAQTDVVPALS